MKMKVIIETIYCKGRWRICKLLLSHKNSSNVTIQHIHSVLFI